jgi:hypothetical protein
MVSYSADRINMADGFLWATKAKLLEKDNIAVRISRIYQPHLRRGQSY